MTKEEFANEIYKEDIYPWISVWDIDEIKIDGDITFKTLEKLYFLWKHARTPQTCYFANDGEPCWGEIQLRGWDIYDCAGHRTSGCVTDDFYQPEVK
jgi:hypothetical protein